MSDIPGPVKREIQDPHRRENFERNKEIQCFGNRTSPSFWPKSIVKIADLMDEYAYLYMELRMGNTLSDTDGLLKTVQDRLVKAIDVLPIEEAYKVLLFKDFIAKQADRKFLPENDTDMAPKA